MRMAWQCPTIHLNKALRTLDFDAVTGGDHCAHGFRSVVTILLNEERALGGDVAEVQLARDTQKHYPAARRSGGIRGNYNRAACWGERVRLIVLVRSPRQPARR
jgi:hypothetical protein